MDKTPENNGIKNSNKFHQPESFHGQNEMHNLWIHSKQVYEYLLDFSNLFQLHFVKLTTTEGSTFGL